MRSAFAASAAVLACGAAAAGLLLGSGRAAKSDDPTPPPAVVAPEPSRPAAPDRLVVHEWGTFTSFSGSDGAPVNFSPSNDDLPPFVYGQEGEADSKASRLRRDGTVSMETPVLYFYAGARTRASVRVEFPSGWITEWYPYAAGAPRPLGRQGKDGGQSIRWEVELLPGEQARFPRAEGDNHYYCARATDATPLRVEFDAREGGAAERRATLAQREKFLFYRGVGRFALPVRVRATGGSKVVVKNTSAGTVGGLVLVTARGGRVGFRALGALGPGAEVEGALPSADSTPAGLTGVLTQELTAAGLYEAEARTMVKTWEAAWFGEEGSRLLYLVPRPRADELLPLSVEPRPAEVVRVLVGRHDFVTPEQEAAAERQVRRSQSARAELEAAEKELRQLGRFAEQARRQAERRLEGRAAAE
jgi:hypothetical protein